MSSAVWMLEENDSCSVRSTGFTLSHLLPRMSTTTVKPRARTSSLTERHTDAKAGNTIQVLFFQQRFDPRYLVVVAPPSLGWLRHFFKHSLSQRC